MATDSAVASTRPGDVGLRRELGLVGAMWASETSIIGSGWLFASLYAAQAVGGAALIAWVAAGIAVIILALVHAELGGMFPVSGGTARFPHFAFGSVAGISFGFFSWLQAVTVSPIECFAVLQYGQYWMDAHNITIYNASTGNVTGLGFVITIILMALFTAVNFLAMRAFGKVNNVITYWKVLIPVLAIIILIFKFHPSNLTAGGGFFPKGTGLKELLEAIPGAGIVFAYLGFEQADQLAGEVKDPQRNLPRAIIGATLIGVIIYCLLQLVFIGATPSDLLGKGFAGIPSTSPIAIGPFAGLAGLVGLSWFAAVLRIDAFISPSGTGLIYETSTSRVGYGLARNRYYPQVFAKVDKRGVPWVSLIVAFVLGLVFLLPFPSWHSLVGLVTSASVLMYAGAPLSMGAFREQIPDHHRPYRMPGAKVLAPIAFIIANLIIYWSGFTTLWKLGIAMIVGYVLIGIFMSMDPQRPKLEWRSAQWLVPYLIVMGLLSWLGSFGGRGDIPFGLDLLCVAVWSLVIYYWAIATRLPAEEMQALVARQSAEQDPTLPEPAA